MHISTVSWAAFAEGETRTASFTYFHILAVWLCPLVNVMQVNYLL